MPAEKIFHIPRGKTVRLAAVLHPAASKKIVVMSHGFTGHKQENQRLFVTAARAIADAGFNALRFDFMGSGDSSGEFYEMSPNTEIADLRAVVAWCKKAGYKQIALLGVSCGGAVTICAAHQLAPDPIIKTIVTWSSVPSFRWWRTAPQPSEPKIRNNPLWVGPQFYTDRPAVDVPEAYCSLDLPKLQVQGSEDIPEFQSRFAQFFPKALGPKKHVVIPGADHVFTSWPDRKKVIGITVAWLKKYLA